MRSSHPFFLQMSFIEKARKMSFAFRSLFLIGFFGGVCDGIFKRASLSYWKLKSANCSCEAPKWATVHVFRLQLRCRCKRRNGGIGREVALEQGGPFFKINCDQFRLLFAFAVKWVERNYGLKDHLTLRLLLYFYRKNRLSAVALLQKWSEIWSKPLELS